MELHEFAAFVGIDWGDQKHAVCLRANGVEFQRELPQRADEIEAWATELRTRSAVGRWPSAWSSRGDR